MRNSSADYMPGRFPLSAIGEHVRGARGGGGGEHWVESFFVFDAGGDGERAPTIVTRTGALPELLGMSEVGCVTADEPHEMARRWRDFLGSGAGRACGMAAYAKARMQYDTRWCCRG